MYFLLGFTIFLVVSLWLIALWFVTFAARTLKRQDVLYHTITARLTALEAALTEAIHKSDAIRASLAQISIPLDEPISKYESVLLPEDATIRFVDKK